MFKALLGLQQFCGSILSNMADCLAASREMCFDTLAAAAAAAADNDDEDDEDDDTILTMMITMTLRCLLTASATLSD